MHPMDTRLDQPAREGRQRITGVDRNRAILGLHPFPVPLGIEDLESRYRLAEEEGYGAQVCVPGAVELADLLVLFGAAGGIMHVPQVVFALDIVLVVADELVFVGKLQQDGEEAEELFDNFGVAFLSRRLVAVLRSIEEILPG